MNHCLIKRNIIMNIKRIPSRKIILEDRSKNYFKDENTHDFLNKYYYIHSKNFNLINTYNNISLFIFNFRFYIIFIIFCVIRLF